MEEITTMPETIETTAPAEAVPWLEVPFEQYTVTEGLLFCVLLTLVLSLVIRAVWGFFCD